MSHHLHPHPFFRRITGSYAALLLVVALTGCATLPATQPPVVGIDGIACIGRVETPPAGLIETTDEALLPKAVAASGAGKLCAGKVYEVTQPVLVYRVWNSAKSYTLYGSWWSFTRPQGPTEKYRQENEICPSWSSLDRMSSCTIRPGSKIVVGPGQSAVCEQDQLTYEKSPVNQVFIPNDSRNNVLYVENCTKGNLWP